MSETVTVTSEGVRLVTPDTFEALVLAQAPARTPWAPVTDYSFEARKEAEGKHPQLIKDVFTPKLVIDAGCGPDAILAKLLLDLDVPVLGFDPQIQENPFARHLFRGSILEPCDQEPWADLVICREVLEHLTLRQIRVAVTNLCAYSSKYVYLTTRFSSEHDLLRVETSDDLDPTHITIPSKDLLRLLFVLEGFKRRADLEEQMDWQQKGRCLVYERAV